MDDTNPDITNALKDLKNGKSTSTDLISNGMLKNWGNISYKNCSTLF